MDGRYAGSVSLAAEGLYFVASRLESWARDAARRTGLGEALYDAVERDTGRPLAPSPLSLMPEAGCRGVPAQAAAPLHPDERRTTFEHALAVGHGFGLGNASVVDGRLDLVFDLEEVAPELVPAASGPRGL